MFFWFTAALLTLGASLAVLLPLTRASKSTASAGAHDLEVYQDQLDELARDARRGLIGGQEAEEARAEIGRRMLKADAATTTPAGPAETRASRIFAMVAVLAVPLASWGIYGLTGSPDLPSQPLQARLEANPAESSVEELIARAEGHLSANPDDGSGWDVLAPVYQRVGRSADSIVAYRNAIRLLGATAAREAGLGEALASAAAGTVTDEAAQAFGRALVLEPGNAKARFFLATAMAQQGKIADAIAAWRLLEATLPPDSPWRQAVRLAVAEGERRLPETGAPGPSQADIDAAAGMTAEDRGAMIETMVAQLDEKLRLDPADPEGWRRLVRSYMVLKREDDARAALERGVAALGKNSVAAAELENFAAGLGLSGTE